LAPFAALGYCFFSDNLLPEQDSNLYSRLQRPLSCH
jgi:hypothetical protein